MEYGTLADVMRDMENGTYNFCKDGECIGCGNCCSNLLPMTDEEIKTIKVYMKKHHIKEQKHINALLVEQPKIDMTCPFLMNSGCERCVIYEVRPRVCRDFICEPKQRPVPDMKCAMKCKPTNVRETFFGK